MRTRTNVYIADAATFVARYLISSGRIANTEDVFFLKFIDAVIPCPDSGCSSEWFGGILIIPNGKSHEGM